MGRFWTGLGCGVAPVPVGAGPLGMVPSKMRRYRTSEGIFQAGTNISTQSNGMKLRKEMYVPSEGNLLAR